MSCMFSLARSKVGSVFGGVGGPIQTFLQQRSISASAVLQGKKNIRKFFLGNKRGTKLFRRERNAGRVPWAPVYTEVQDPGFKYDTVWHKIPEMVPEFVVPDLTDCDLKPYVSYKAADIFQSEFTAQDLFDIVYKNKITNDFKANKLDEAGNPLEPSEMEKMTPDEAWILARKSGSDIFSERIPKLWECLDVNLLEEKPRYMAVSSYDEEMTHPSEVKKALGEPIPSQRPPEINPAYKPLLPRVRKRTYKRRNH